MMNIIKRCWRGEEKLWKVFWLYGVLFSIGLKIAVGIVLLISPTIAGIVGLFLMIFNIPYMIWSLVSTWRCAFNVRVKFWGYLARFYAGVAPVLVIIGLVIGGILVAQDLIVAAKCRKEVTPMAAELGVDFETFKQQFPDRLPKKCQPKQTLESGE